MVKQIKASFSLIKSRPVLGYGFRPFSELVKEKLGLLMSGAHNQYLSICIKTGILGLLGYFIFIYFLRMFIKFLKQMKIFIFVKY